MSQTTVEIIDPKHQYFEQTVTVQASYDWIWIFGETAEHCNVSLHASQVQEVAARYGLEARKLKQTPIVNPEAPVIDSQG